MATEGVPRIEVDDDRVRVSEFEVADSTVVEYLRQFDDDQEREDAFVRALRVGVTTMDLAETSQQEEYVERKFTEMQRDLQEEIDRIEDEVEEKFGDDGHVPQIFDDHLGQDGHLKQHIEDAFSEDGPFTERLDEELGEDGERIQKALDPDTEGTPTYRLKRTLQDQIQDLRDKIEEQATAEETEEEIRQRTTLKGDDFEDTVENMLSDLVYNTSNEVEYTGDTNGEISGRKVGDFVITLNDTGQRIVVEAKSDSGYSQRDIKEELADAVENRDADYGIVVFECESYIPDKVGYFHEFDSERLSVALKETEDDDVEPGFLRIAYNWARTRAVQGYVDSGTAFDPEAIQNAVSEVSDSIDRFSTIRKKTTSIRKTANEIDEELEEIEGEVKSELADIRTEIQTAE
ncbi:restriction endonuclease [Halobacterium sp. MBLA0001]|uniref:restriction endonuclease n=1 Tax=Halobacterium sp. MBLA0001 TaxID=3413511 RepID=UPI003C718270